MKSRLSVVLLFVLLPLLVRAQDDATLYLQQAGGSALLYRGHIANSYPMAYNGTYFWESPVFVQGSVTYNGRVYRDVRLNIDAVRQDLLVESPAVNIDSKVLAREFVERFSLGARPFLNLRKVLGPEAPDGYWEVLYDGRVKLVKQISRSLRKDVDGSLWAQAGYEEGHVNTGGGALMTFVRTVRYGYITEEGSFVPVRKRSDILRYYKDRKREINRHVSNMETAGRLSFERFALEAVQFAESR